MLKNAEENVRQSSCLNRYGRHTMRVIISVQNAPKSSYIYLFDNVYVFLIRALCGFCKSVNSCVHCQNIEAVTPEYNTRRTLIHYTTTIQSVVLKIITSQITYENAFQRRSLWMLSYQKGLRENTALVTG